MRFAFTHSHAFPGGQVLVEDEARTDPECLVEFRDGVTVIAEWHWDEDAIRLMVPTYRTAKGTQVAAHTWHLVRRQDGTWRSER